MRRVVIVQARMGSTRLPGKVLVELRDRPMLAWQLERLGGCRRVDEIVVATTETAEDDAIVEAARRAGCRWFRGSEHDVLARYLGAAHDAGADIVVRVTADCPLIDPSLTDSVIEALAAESAACDYASNVLERTYPRGLDVEALFRDTLERCGRLATTPAAREHVTYFLLEERPELFLRRSITDRVSNADLRWTVDTPEDLQMLQRLFEATDLDAPRASYAEILAYVRAHPELARINAHIAQKGAVG